VFNVRKVQRYQKGNQKPLIEEGLTVQWPREKKEQRDEQWSTKHYKELNI
jgi:hypothetical protein